MPMESAPVRIENIPEPAYSEPKHGLLLHPEFPDSSFWSYRHIMPMVGKKAAFPPLGLITFAALMPDNWTFEMLDLNVDRPPDEEIRARIDAADAVFVSAMSVQKPSLVRLLDGPGRGSRTPWVLGGPFPSSYRDHILEPRTPSDEILYRGLDVLVWGEGGQWVEAINRLLHTAEGGVHSDGCPTILIPPSIAAQQPGERHALNDRSVFKELGPTPPPRWDLVNIRDYRTLMMQTTVGCRFRCDFCDIIQFNGGFTRPKTLESVRRELEVLRELGYRGGIFTVDDNFIGNPEAIESILHVMIDFQREYDYPFTFFTQASLDLGTPKLAHLLPLMKQAGFDQVFLGIENPDPAALKGMNKKQNIKVDIAETVTKLQSAGIEVMAGFIFGGDEDTIETADAIATFAEQVSIPSAMAGMLTPVPHTPLAERLRAEGRLMEAEYSGNNTDDDVQFIPRRMTVEEMQRGYYVILERLFGPGEMYRRASALLDRLDPHIFRSKRVRRSDARAAFRSLWIQGIVKKKRIAYFRLLAKAAWLDYTSARKARREAGRVQRRLRELSRETTPRLAEVDIAGLSALVDRARDALVRSRSSLSLEEAGEWASRLKERIEARAATAEDLSSLSRWSHEFFNRQRQAHRFAGAYLAKAFELAIKGLHYEIAMRGVIRGRGFHREVQRAT